MSTNLSPDHEAVLDDAVSHGMFADKRQALDAVIQMLQGRIEIEHAVCSGSHCGEPMRADAEFWEANRAEIIRLY